EPVPQTGKAAPASVNEISAAYAAAYPGMRNTVDWTHRQLLSPPYVCGDTSFLLPQYLPEIEIGHLYLHVFDKIPHIIPIPGIHNWQIQRIGSPPALP